MTDVGSRIWGARLAGLVAAALLLAGCGEAMTPPAPAPTTPVFHEETNPRTLSAWNVVAVSDGALALQDGVVPYDLATSLFTDYAHKLRTIWMPEGAAAAYRDNDVVDFPVGTIISKTFYYPRVPGEGMVTGAVGRWDTQPTDFVGEGLALDQVRLIETRLLVHRAHGWDAIPYVWNAEQTEARLMRAGDAQPLTLVAADGEREEFSYIVPNQNQCAGCHATNNTTREIWPIGPKPRHLNKDYPYADGVHNQLAHWTQVGYLTGAPGDLTLAPQNALWGDESASLDARARAYLDANCSHCHSDVGPADTSGLDLRPDTPLGLAYGVCKLPVAAGSGTGGRRFDIVPGAPDESIFVYRMNSRHPGVMMPELGRATIHREGVDLVSAWIAAMEGSCG